ncbi:MAG: TolC family protein [Deltaproteobacteria bacterium]|nr:TolC family protein [Deltaproteobacteria bacterium]
MKNRMPAISIFLLCFGVIFFPGFEGAYSEALPVVRIGLIGDGPSAGRLDLNAQVFMKEILEVTRNEFDVRFPREKTLFADMTREGINQAIDRLLQDPEVDIVITLGSVASSEICKRGALQKPVIAPIVIDVELQGLPIVRGTSGVKNLSYITSFKKAGRDVKIFRGMVPFSRLTVLIDRLLMETFPKVREIAEKISRENAIEISIVPATDSAETVLAALGPETEAVFLSPLVRFTPVEFDHLVNGLIEKGLPSFSLWGKTEVEQGVLAAVSPKSDITRLARRVALNVQRILIGEDPATFQVALFQGLHLSINMATARSIGYSPDWNTLTEADLINEEVPDIPRRVTLESAVNEALAANLDLAAANREVAAGEEEVRISRSVMFPQVDLSVLGVIIDDDRAGASLGSQAERTLSGSATLTQLIYSEDARSNYDVRRSIQAGREQERTRVLLDIIFEAAVDYLNLLKAKTIEGIQKENLKVTRSNLELARFRESIGYSGPSDVFRWESEIATDRIAVLNAGTQRRVAEIALNRVLNRPLEEQFATEETDIYDPSHIIGEGRLDKYIDNPENFSIFRDFIVREGLEASPELKNVNASISAQRRILLRAKRAVWLPVISLQADITQIFSEGGEGSDASLGALLPVSIPEADDTEWSISALASFPLFEGGAKKAEINRSIEELGRLKLERASAAERVEERIRSALHVARTAFTTIEFSNDAARAARKNLELITDSYSRGVVGIIDLLDAQTASLVADLEAANAATDFLIALMNAQRAAGGFDLLMTAEEREDWFRRLEAFFHKAKS